jgi:hypothetical protein
MTGEGFAFFRWHCVRYRHLLPGECLGYTDSLVKKPFTCSFEWRKRNP